ncbi:MAG: sigma 54-interacting transcriptional regulator [Gammaproteobacteria bacterium]|nr:sigma 54-interacting transcriptional regulator [Gammaproteobacteria bacterium]
MTVAMINLRPIQQPTQSYVVQAHSLEQAIAAVAAVGGEVTHELRSKDAVAARLGAAQLTALRGVQGVRRVCADRDVSTASSMLTASTTGLQIAPGCASTAVTNLTFDADWPAAGSSHPATYTNLPSGQYTLRAQAARNDGVWSEQRTRFDFIMRPALWTSGWAYTLYLLALAAILLWALRMQARQAQQAAKLKYAEELSVVQARLNDAQRIANIGNWDWNTVTNELWWSDEVYRLFQQDPDTFNATYESFLEHVHPDDRDAVKQAVTLALNGQQAYSIDHRIIRRDGSERIVHERAEVTFDAKGLPVRMAGTVHDITERKTAENDIRHRADFQALLARLSSELIRAQPDEIDQQMSAGLELIGTQYALDAISIWWFTEEQDCMRSRHRWVRVENTNRKYQLGRTQIPWISTKLLTGECIVIDDIEHMPVAAATDRDMLRERGTKSALIVPLHVDETLRGACAYSVFRETRGWSAATVAELRLIAENLAGAIARSRAIAEIKQLKEKLQDENIRLREEIRLAHGFDEVIGEDPKLKRCLAAVEKVAPTDAAVLVLGETGTGKELIARAIHDLSTRRDRPMVSVNCPALPADIIESELFGHEKGAFTGAQSLRRGRFELADGGTIFLDEIGEMPLELQSKLLRVLQTGDFERLGGTETMHVDVRLIAATNRDLQQTVQRGEFRADLYYRVGSFPIQLPPLRERKGDIPLLAEHFVHKHAKRLGKEINAISARMIRELTAYSWPGNIRELESTIERALISSPGGAVLELPGPIPWIVGMGPSAPGWTLGDNIDLTTVERSHIVNVLERTQWKISGDDGAAAILGMPSSTLRSKMKRLGIRRQAP